MGLKWSWAWGPETALVLENSSGWDLSSTAASNIAPSASGGADPEYTYAGSPTRYTINLKSSSWCRSPLGSGAPQGWLSSHWYLNTASSLAGYYFFQVTATSNGRGIYVQGASGNTIKFYVDNSFKEQTTAVFPSQTWHNIAIKYDMSGTTWSGQLWMNGVAVTSDWTDSGVAQTSCHFQISGLINGTLAGGAFWAGLLHYDDMADAGATTGLYVTRVSPTADVSESGSWTPASGGTAQTTELASPLNTATTVTEPTPASGDNVVLNVNNLGTQLGVTPNIYGVTTHAYADGTGISIEAAVGEGGTYSTGDSVVAGAATYATVTAPTKPAGGAWSSGDTVLLKIEVS